MPDEANVLLAPRPTRCRARVDDAGRELTIHAGRSSFGKVRIAAFISLWLIGWSACCSFLLKTVMAAPTLFNVLFAVPFFASWFAVCGSLIGLMFGRQWLRIGPEGLEYRFSAIVPLRHRHIPLTEVKQAAVGQGLYIATVGEPIYFGRYLGDDEQRWLVDLVNQRLDLLRPRPSIVDNTASNPKTNDLAPPRSAPEVEVLVRARRPTEPPSDSQYQVMQDFERLCFVHAGRWDLGLIGMTTFINLFWNSILGLFLARLVREFQWDLFFFLIPFEVIGLLVFGFWLFALAAPACRERWTFDRRQVARRASVLGLGRTRRYPVGPFDRIALERRLCDRQPWDEAESDYGLSFISLDQRIVIQIEKLTEGEARWLADQLLRTYPDWFRSNVPA
jgi:hypothetical protein